MTDEEILYGDGTGRPMGLFTDFLRPDDRGPLHPGHMTRQRRRAAHRAAAKAGLTP